MGYKNTMKIINIMMVLFQQVAGLSLHQDHKSSAFRTTTTTTTTSQHTSFFRYRRRTTNALSFRHSGTSIRSKQPEGEEFEFYDDGIGDISSRKYNDNNNDDNDNDASSSSSGDDLVGEFYKEIDRRENQFDYVGDKLKEEEEAAAALKKEKKDDTTFSDPLSTFLSPSSLFDDNGEEKNSLTSKSSNKPKQKFTGKTNNIVSSRNTNNYFGGQGGGSFSSSNSGNTNTNTNNNNSNNNSNGVREEMMRNEFNLVSAATGKTSFIIQVGITLSMLIFFIYIGLSGGIVTGDDVEAIRGSGVDDMIQFDQIIPIPTDTEASVWL
jgi:hypothetical protein